MVVGAAGVGLPMIALRGLAVKLVACVLFVLFPSSPAFKPSSSAIIPTTRGIERPSIDMSLNRKGANQVFAAGVLMVTTMLPLVLTSPAEPEKMMPPPLFLLLLLLHPVRTTKNNKAESAKYESDGIQKVDVWSVLEDMTFNGMAFIFVQVQHNIAKWNLMYCTYKQKSIDAWKNKESIQE